MTYFFTPYQAAYLQGRKRHRFGIYETIQNAIDQFDSVAQVRDTVNHGSECHMIRMSINYNFGLPGEEIRRRLDWFMVRHPLIKVDHSAEIAKLDGEINAMMSGYRKQQYINEDKETLR